MRTFQELIACPDTPLRRQAANGVDVMAWLKQAQLTLLDAKMTAVSPVTRMDAAYDAVLFCCLAVACAQGYRCGSERGHHAVVLEGAVKAMGLGSMQYDALDTLRDWRNRKYRGGLRADPREVDEAIEIVEPFLATVADWFAANHAQLLKRASGPASQ